MPTDARSVAPMNGTVDADRLLELYAELGALVVNHTKADDAFSGITQVAVTAIPGTHFASVTRGRGDHFQTLAPTAPVATDADRLQYELDSGPCVDSVVFGTSFITDDLAADVRWPEFGPRAARAFGVASMLSVRIVVDSEIDASLNLYSRDRQAFSPSAQTLTMLLAAHAGVMLGGIRARERVDHMDKALATSRRIGMAIGILMSVQRVTAEQAFDLLRIASQSSNRRVSAIAEDVVESGELQMSQTS